ncbi:uncharacterized mitochondrial protein-like protein [Tanacetum coccineum]
MAHSTVKRPINKNTSFKNSNINQRVNTVRGKEVNTARPKAVVNAVKGNNVNVVKASASWVWKPKTKVFIPGTCPILEYKEIDGGYVAFGGNSRGVPKRAFTFHFAKAKSDESKLWHRRLGHLNFKTMNKLVKGNLVRGLPSKLFENYQTCVACQKGKQHKASCKSKTENSIGLPLHLLHMDLFGPTFVKSLMKKMYCLVVTDDFSRFTWVFFLATKDETSGILKSFITGIENLVDHKVKVIRCDNGTEFKNKEMKGILRQYSIARTPQQNEVAKRRNKTLIEGARTMLADSKLPTTFWAEAVNTACYVQQSNGLEDPKSSQDDGSKPSSDDGKKVDEDSRKDSKRNYDEDVGAEADMHNVDTAIQVSPIPTTRIHKDHPLYQVIGDLQSATQTRRMSESLDEHGKNHRDGLQKIRHASTPIEKQKPLLKDEDGNELDVHMYRSMIGSLMYLTSSRPDIMFVVCACARYQVNPKVSHLHDVKRIFRYLKGQPKLGLWYPKDSPFDLVAYTDSDYAGASLDRKSTTGGCQFLGCRLKETDSVNAARHYLLLLVKVNVVRHNLLLLVKVNAASYEGDSLVRAATTASSLEAEQDSGNINITRSKATLNEPSSPGTSSGSGPRCQETMGDIIAQTRFKNVSKHSNDSLLARGNTLRSDEDRLKLNELMTLCTNLQQRVLDLEKTKTTQAEEIVSLKRRVKKLEQKKRSRTHGLKRLRRVGATARVESSGDEQILGEDASKQGRINYIDADEDITLVNQNENVVEEVVDAAQVSTAVTTITITTEEITLAQALEALKNSKPKVKGIVFQEPGESTTTTTTISSQQSQDKEAALKLQAEFDEEERLAREKAKKEKEANISLIEEWDDIQANIDVDHQLAERLQAEEQEQFTIEEKTTLFKELLEERRKHFVAKRAEEKRNKPPTKTQQKKTMITYLKNMELVQESTKKQKVEDDKEITKLKQCLEIILDEEEVTIDDVPLAVKSPRIVDWKIHKEGKKSYYQIVRADGKSQMYMIFSHMLKSFDKEDLEDLYKLVKAKYGSTRPMEDLDLVLWNDLKNMFEPHVEDTVWRNQQGYKVLEWKLYDSCKVHFLRMQSMQIYMLVEKKYPLTPPTLSQILLNAASITAALIDVNAAQSKLVLLENFNENYSKCLRLLVKLQLSVQSYYC